MKTLNSYTDEDLFKAFPNKKDLVAMVLYKRYKSEGVLNIKRMITSANLLDFLIEDAEVIFDELFFVAFENFSLEKGKFSRFFRVVLKRNMGQYLLKLYRQKDPLLHFLSLSSKIPNTDLCFDDILGTYDVDLDSSEKTNEIMMFSPRAERKYLSKKEIREKEILKYKMLGLSYREIAKKLKISIATVSRVLASSKKDIY